MNEQDFDRASLLGIFIYLVAILLIGMGGTVAEVILSGCKRVFERKMRDAFLQQ